jgi:hypothetical protein
MTPKMDTGHRTPPPRRQENTAMRYISIVLELIQEQYPKLHRNLCQERALLLTANLHALALKRYHEDRMEQLSLAKPDRDPIQIASQALELALLDLQEDLPSESNPTDAGETCSLDAAMAFVRSHTPPA